MPGMVEYGREGAAAPDGRRGSRRSDHGGEGDAARRRSRSRSGRPRWRTRPATLAQARQILDRLLDDDLETWGYPRAGHRAQLDAVDAVGPAQAARPWNRYALERRLLVRLRRNIHQNAFGRLVKRVRFVCDVLLR